MTAYDEISAALETICLSTFGAEGYNVRHDRLHPSLGAQRALIGISLEGQSPDDDNFYVMNTDVLVQVYSRYRLEVDPEQRVDPRLIAAQAQKFMDAVRNYNVNSTGNLWFFNIVDIDYPEDPTGNKTRFEVRVQAKSNNPVLVETTG